MAKKDKDPQNQPPTADPPEQLAEAIAFESHSNLEEPLQIENPASQQGKKVAFQVELANRPTQPERGDQGSDPRAPFLVEVQPRGGGGPATPPVKVSLGRTEVIASEDQALWVAIRQGTNAIGFKHYQDFIDDILCAKDSTGDKGHDGIIRRARRDLLRPQFHGVDAYELLKTATKIFLVTQCGVRIDSQAFNAAQEDSRLLRPASATDLKVELDKYLNGNDRQWLPYLDTVIRNIQGKSYQPPGAKDPENPSPFCTTLIHGRITDPCLLELIWSYWHEEGMLVQTINSLALRFQNKKVAGPDPLANLELDPLRPLSNILWGYVQDENNRLTLPRRAYEYEHHYGISLVGRAVPAIRPADRRSKFLEAFHSLLHRTANFYREDADTTVISDGFPLLNSLQEVHMLLAEGAHNQYGDLPWTARVEMLAQQWILSRPEVKEFLRGRHMVPYKESWMAPVDALKKLKGLTDTPVSHFRDLGVYGEQILLSVRFGNWSEVIDQNQAKNWARYWKPEIQSYIHGYRAVTGVDLTQREALDSTPPAIHLRNRQLRQAG